LERETKRKAIGRVRHRLTFNARNSPLNVLPNIKKLLRCQHLGV